VFCKQCSTKKAAIPQYGFEEEVRVCDVCYSKLTSRSGGGSSSLATEGDSDLPQEYLNSALFHESQAPPQRGNESEQKQQEEDELQMALALSLSEEEASKQKQKQSLHSYYGTGSSSSTAAPVDYHPAPVDYHPVPSYSSAAESRPSAPQAVSTNPEMARYEDRAYWERRRAEQQQLEEEYEMPNIMPSASAVASASAVIKPSSPEARAVGVVEEDERGDYQTLIDSLQRTIGLFTTRMQQVSASGKSVALDSSVQSLFHSLNAMHPQLLSQIETQGQAKDYYDGLEKKLQGVKEARTSLNRMRRQNREKQQQLEEERMMLERLQMQQKIELLRQQRKEEEHHQEMLRQQRQKQIEDQQKAQEGELQRRLMEHQQRQMELHLSVRAEQQNQLRQYGLEASEMPVYSQDQYAPVTAQPPPSQLYSLPPQLPSQYQYIPSSIYSSEPQIPPFGQGEPQSFASLPSVEPSQSYRPPPKELPPMVSTQSRPDPGNIGGNVQVPSQSQVYAHQSMQSIQPSQPVQSLQPVPAMQPNLSQPGLQMNHPQTGQPSHNPTNPALSSQYSYQVPPQPSGYLPVPSQPPPIQQQSNDPTQPLHHIPRYTPPMQRKAVEDPMSYTPGYSFVPHGGVQDDAPTMQPTSYQPAPNVASLQTGRHQGYASQQPKQEALLISFD
jgi:growth factor-regulated tyrosine kinase substrate